MTFVFLCLAYCAQYVHLYVHPCCCTWHYFFLFFFWLSSSLLYVCTTSLGASLVAQRLKRLPPMQETRVQSLGREDPLEKEMVTHSSTLTWRIPWTEKPGMLQSTGSQSRPRLSGLTSLAPLLYPFICQWTFELSPCPGYCQ